MKKEAIGYFSRWLLSFLNPHTIPDKLPKHIHFAIILIALFSHVERCISRLTLMVLLSPSIVIVMPA